jgi:hypothetical protein
VKILNRKWLDSIILWYYNIIVSNISKRRKSMTEKEKVRNITIRMPYDIWIKLRRMQEEDKIKSIQQACVEGLELIIKERR